MDEVAFMARVMLVEKELFSLFPSVDDELPPALADKTPAIPALFHLYPRPMLILADPSFDTV
jgi:hypothetical protein